MDLTKNQKIAIGAGCGCLVLVFIVVLVSGGLAFLAFNRDGKPTRQEQPVAGGDKGTAPQPVAGGGNAPAGDTQPAGGDQPGTTANLPETVRRQLEQANGIAGQQGYTPIGGPASGALRNQTQEDVSVNLTSGVDYLMVGVCDGDCSDMDLRLFSPSGEEIAQDIATDDTPVLRFTAGASGAHQARVIMATCTNEPCAYGVALYSKQ